jgi:serine protease AprX
MTGPSRYPAEFGPGARPGRPPRATHRPASPGLVPDTVISPPLHELMSRSRRSIGIVIELNGRHPLAADRVLALLTEPAVVNGSYVTTALTSAQIRELVRADRLDGAGERAVRGAIYRIWPNFQISALITRSIVTTKCQAVQRSFNATGRGVTWAVLDSGIQGDHGHFTLHDNLGGLPHKSFVDDAPLRDDAGHGTHVAGILAGEQAGPLTGAVWYQDDAGVVQPRVTSFPSICGMAPECKLLSCKVLRADESGDITALLAALQYIGQLNSGGRDLVVHGVNISVGHPFDPSWFATGLTPVCREVDNLVRSGVVVVVAAGNTGYGFAGDSENQLMRVGFEMTINDPGNAALALTVGSTSSSPHSTGVSYFSSKGPTGDGRMKPDLVAPGERVISAAAGALAVKARSVSPDATYIENSGTSMAAPHVSGAAAAFLSVHREFLGQPDAVGRALLSTATDLGRARTFQGAGLIDAMRAIQSV